MEILNAEHYIKKFVEDNPEYAEIQATDETITIGQFHDIDEKDDEVWIMQCPKGTDLTRLQGEKLKFPGRSNIQGLEAVAVEFDNTVSQSFGYCRRKGKYALRLLALQGSIVLRHKLKANDPITTEEIDSICPASSRVPVPEGMKLRHPLLGVQFEDKLKVDKVTRDRLRKADETSAQVLQETRNRPKALSNNKRRKPMETIQIGSAEEDDDVEFVGVTQIKKKKKKKRKLSECASSLGNNDAKVVEESPRKKAKKSKKYKKAMSADEEEVEEDLQWLKQL